MIYKAILTPDEQLKYGIPIINFEYLSLHPEDIPKVGEKYLSDISFRYRVKERMSYDVYFKIQCMKYLEYYLKYEENIESSKKQGR